MKGEGKSNGEGPTVSQKDPNCLFPSSTSLPSAILNISSTAAGDPMIQKNTGRIEFYHT